MASSINHQSRIALVCRSGPENGPFSAAAASVINRELLRHGLKLQGIYVCSGSVPTALLGCTGELNKLCGLWEKITPEDIVGNHYKLTTMLRAVSRESMFRSDALRHFIEKAWDLDGIFSSSAIMIQIPALDLLSNELIIFTNKNPKHKRWFMEGVLGSKALIPFLNGQFAYDPEEYELIEPGKAVKNCLFLVDGGYKASLLLEQAVRDGFDQIFVIDIHGLVPEVIDPDKKYFWPNILQSSVHSLACTNDARQMQIVDRINEEITLKKQLQDVCATLPETQQTQLREILARMDYGRLRLYDKDETTVHMVSNPEKACLFNFVSFESKDVPKLLRAG